MPTQVIINTRKLDDIKLQSPQKAREAVLSLLHEGQAYVMEHMGEQGSPAPEGAYPGIRTGELKNSITVNPTGDTSGEIATDKDYAPPLEFGSSRMGARPFMLPMAYWLEEQVEPAFARFIE